MYISYLCSLIVTLFICKLIYGRFFEKRNYYALKQILFLISLCLIIIPSYICTGSENYIILVLAWIITGLVLWLTIKVSYKISTSMSFFLSIWIVISWQWIVEYCLSIASRRNISFERLQQEEFDILGFVIIYSVTIIWYLFIYELLSKAINDRMPRNLGPRQISLTTLLFVIFETVAINFKWPFDITINENWRLIIVTQIAIGVILFLECELFKSSALKKELETMQMLWGTHEEQYHLSRVNIDLINQKTHDLKHLIRGIKTASPEEIDKYLSELEDTVGIYEAIVKTGNDVLDTIITEKSLYCRKHNIKISCVADGSKLKFINTIDLYSILGNALDNAIEAVRKIEDYDLRTIDIMIYQKDKFLSINIINPVKDEVIFGKPDNNQERVPVTTKQDKKSHGYGIKSIKYIVAKYDGFTSISVEDGCFSLKLLIPIPTTYV